MTARTETVGECKVLYAGGRIDFESSLDFEQQVNSMIQSGGNRFVIELSEVELLSSAGLRVLLSTAKRVQHRHAELALASPSPVVLQVFRISHFDLLFKIFPTLREALAAFGVSAAPLQEYGGAALGGTGGASALAASSAKPTEESSVEAASVIAARREEKALESAASSARKTAEPPEDRFSPEREASAQRASPVPRSSLPVGARPTANLNKNVSTDSSAEAKTVVPPPLPIPAPPTEEQESARGATPPPVPAAVSAERPRREASYPALLEIRAEGISYPCKDGDVIGTAGRVASSFFASIAGLEARHLLVGQEGDRWFVFTPKNVAYPFLLDGMPLVAGERKFLDYVEHQMEFCGHVFGLRLIPDRRKKGLFGRFSSK
jgi:anti-sigma B factor antagonist